MTAIRYFLTQLVTSFNGESSRLQLLSTFKSRTICNALTGISSHGTNCNDDRSGHSYRRGNCIFTINRKQWYQRRVREGSDHYRRHQMSRISFKLRIGSNPVQSLTAEEGRILGGLILFQGKEIENICQIGRIYREDDPNTDIEPSYELKQTDAQKIFVVEKALLPLMCSPVGSGYTSGEACIPQEFHIKTHRKAGGGWPVEVTIRDPNGETVESVLGEDEGDLHKVTYTPPVDGEYTITTTIRVIRPVIITIGAMAADPSQCIAYGPGLEGAEQLKPATFTVEARNKLGEKIPNGGHPFKIDVKGPFGEPVDAKIEDNGDGTYAVTYNPILPGDHVAEVKLNNQHIKDSPFKVLSDYSTETANAAQSWAEGPGLESGTCSTRMPDGPATFTIHAASVDGTPKTNGGDLFSVLIEDPLFNSIPANVEDNHDGTYTVTYVPIEPGNHVIDVILRNPVRPVLYEHVKDSPFNVEIKAGTDPSKCTADGPGLKDGILDTFPAKFTITARDRDGKPIPEGGDNFSVKVTDPEGNEVPVDVHDNGDGTYDVTYNPDVPGPHVVNTVLDGVNIKDSPKAVVVKPGAYAGTSYIERYSFLIRTCDKRGKPLTTGGQDIHSLIFDTVGSAVDLKIQDNNDGSYLVTYSLPQVEGRYSLNATVDGKDVIGSPWEQTVGPVQH
eukprot:TRINITY_DN89_c0_g1_i1.p1 TRINITY_DN89_c0_g1~~TRINITY_DN89_c0_g1_i1.p1  ORF type:complete len:673 (-),score=152.43 TRINITY_DN89_c0_g1_i1:100-2118(-)